MKVKVLVAQSLCNPVDCSTPDSSVHGISQARILEWVAIPFSRGSSWARDWTQVSCTACRFFTLWATNLTGILIKKGKLRYRDRCAQREDSVKTQKGKTAVWLEWWVYTPRNAVDGQQRPQVGRGKGVLASRANRRECGSADALMSDF